MSIKNHDQRVKEIKELKQWIENTQNEIPVEEFCDVLLMAQTKRTQSSITSCYDV